MIRTELSHLHYGDEAGLAAVAAHGGAWAPHWLPGRGRAIDLEHTEISGEHLLERIRLFFIIALGESVLTTGNAFTSEPFELERLDEEGELALSSLRGKAVVLNVWASWCAPCREEAPYFEQLWRENRSRGLAVVGLNAKDFRRDARGFMRRYELTFPVVFDGPGETVGRYGVTGFPETFVLDREGRVIEVFVGAVNSDEDREELEAAVDRALES